MRPISRRYVLHVYSQLAHPLPSGVSPNDLDASVKFEFPFPSVVRLLHSAESLWRIVRICAVFLMHSFACVGGGPEGQNQYSKEHQQSRV